MTRCPCGNEPHVSPPCLQARREAMRIRAVEMSKRLPDEPLPAWCGACILERLPAFLTEDEDDIDEVNESAAGGDWDRWIDGIRERMAKDERRTR
ncbi:hypothetical protein WMF38_56980 [Sorangium sp. So ce118]